MFRSPYRRRSWKFLALAVVSGAVLFLTAGGAVALFFLGWMPFPSSTSPGKAVAATVVVAPSKSARLASPAGDVLLEFPAGSVDRQTTVSYRRMSTATVTGLPPGFTLTDKVFDLSVAAAEARDDMEFRFLQPVTVTVFLTGEEATAFNDSHSNVAIQRFDPDARKWIPLQTTIDPAARTAQVKIQAANSLALTVKKPVSSPERVLTHGPVLPQGYLGRGVVSLTIPKELDATNTARVSLRIALRDQSPPDRSTPRSGEGQITPERQPPTVGDSPVVVREAPVPVHRQMSFTLDAPGFEMAPSSVVPQQVRDGQAGWSWIITPNEGPLGEREVSALVTANGRTLSTLKTSVMVTRPEPRTAMTTDTTLYPHPTATPPPAPVPTSTPVVKLATVVIPPASPTPTPVVIPTAAPPVPTASPVPVSLPTAVPSTTPKANERLATATPTPTVKPSPLPRFQLFINGVQAPALNDMMSVGGRTVVLSQAAEADGAFQFNDKITIAATLPPGYRVEWRGVDAIRGPFATIYMNQDRFVAFDVVPPPVTATPIPMPVPFYQPQPRVRERPAVVPTPTPSPVRTFALTVEVIPKESGIVSPAGVTHHRAGAQVSLTATATGGYVFSHWSEPCHTGLDCMVTMDGDKMFTAHFTHVFELTTYPSPADGGTVVPSDATLHRASTRVTVMASPAEGRQFSQWTGDCSGSGACVVTMNSGKSVTAEFVRVFDLNTEAIPPEGGAMFPEGRTSHREDAQVTVITSPADGYQFSEWGGDCSGDGPCVVTIKGHETVTAKFLPVSDLTLTADPEDGGTVMPGGVTSYVASTQVIVLAHPGPGYRFSNWSGACTGDGPCVVRIDGDATVTAKFDRGIDLTVTPNPPNGGAVLPEGRTSHKPDTTVTIFASPAEGYQFSEWTGGCTGSGDCVVTMDDDKSVTANFVRVFTLTAQANPVGDGTVSPDNATSHTAGSQVTIIANPTDDYQFSEWDGDCTGRGACVVTMDADQWVTANFAPVFDLTVASDPANGGTVLPGGMTSYVGGTKVTVLAYPAAGYRFSEWSGDCTGNGPCVVTINGDTAVIVRFARGVNLTVAANPPDGGTVLPAGKTSHRPGAAVTVVASPADGYQFSEWTGDCTGSSACVVTMDAAKSVTAEFVRVFDLTVTAVPPGGGALSPGANTIHASGTEVTVISNPADGYQFSEWAGGCTGSGDCVVTMDDDKSVTANFVRVFTLTAQANPPAGGTVSPDSTTSYTAGSQVTVIANPTDGHQFSGWGGNCTGRSPCVVTMDADKSVTANFASVFDLTVAADPADGGTVLPGGVTSYVDGAQITVLAYPAPGYLFSEWGGACSGSGPCMVTIDGDKTVTAKFVIGIDLTVAANPVDGGLVYPQGATSQQPGDTVTVVAVPAIGYQFSNWTGDCTGSSVCTVILDTSKTVTANFVGVFDLTVTAVPTGGGTVFPGSTTSYVAGYEVAVLARSAVGYQFSEWGGDCSGYSACVVTMDAHKSVTANFGPVFKLTAAASPNEGGTILPEGITSFLAGTQVTVLAHSAPDYQLAGWSDGCSGGGPCVVIMDTDKSVTANFARVFDLTVASSPANGGTVFPSGTTSYVSNSQVTLTARPGYGYGFSGWDGDCSGSGPCELTMDDNKSVTANFIKQFVLTAVASPSTGGEVSPPGTTQHAEGTEVTVTAGPAEGYGFSGWSGACSGTDACIVIMDGDKTVTANFFTRFTLTTMAEPSSGGTVSPEGTTSYDAGSEVTVTATPATGYTFSSWGGDCSGSGSCVVTMDGDKSATAKFTSTAAIAFHSSRDGNSEIYVMDTDGSNMTRLTNNTTVDSDPNWSLDGSKIIFVATRDGNSEIYIMNVDGSNPVNLTNNEAEDVSPAWSPNGTKIAFVSTRGSQQDIYVMDADGSNQTKLTDDAHLDDSPDWLPDGSQIVFASNREGNNEIHKMQSDGTNVNRLTNSPEDDLSPVWSPDGHTIAFTSFRDGDAEVYTMFADGTNDYNITFAVTEDESPAWSPDSAKIVLVSDQTDIVIFDAEDPESIEAITVKTGGSSDGGLDWKLIPSSGS